MDKLVHVSHMTFFAILLPKVAQNWASVNEFLDLSFGASKEGLSCNIELVLNTLKSFGL